MPDTDPEPVGLASPDEGPLRFKSRQRDEDRVTRKPVAFWDRIKVLLIPVALFFVFVLASMGDNPLLPFSASASDQLRAKWWLVALAAVEAIRQVHLFATERSAAYYAFWSSRVFGRWEQRIGRMNDWTRYRVGRMIRILVVLAVADFILAAVLHTSPVLALVQLPITLFRALPLLFQLLFGVFFIILEFGAMFWFLSRGGTDVYFPDDIKTRFSDVWGQDSVLEKIKENIVFLEDPESIEEKGGYVPGGILLWGPPGTGKGEPVSSRVMTPSGPRPMGTLRPGHQVIGADGHPTTVLEVHLLGERDIFRVQFSDGTSLRTTEDHLWQVESRYGGRKVLAVSDLVDRLTEADGHARYRIPMVKPVEFAERSLPLDPYLLGALLGDGTFRHHVGISSADLDVLARVESLLPGTDSLVRKSRYDWSLIGGTTRVLLKEMGLFGCYSYEKFIPEEYLWTGAESRLSLLRGLMDTDGTVDKRGVIEFHTTSPRLAEGVRLLVQSFGGTAGLSTRDTRYGHGGRHLRGRPITTVRMALPPGLIPFVLERKVDRVRPRTTYLPARRMTAIVPDGREEARCIRVAAADHLYVSEHFIVTHNTLMAEAVAGETGKPYVFVDPGAFQNMFMGVGILKVKGLFRKLRKLAVRYGGVIVFFDEADSLGNRGALTPGGVFGGGRMSPDGRPHAAPAWRNAVTATDGPWNPLPSCNGLTWVSPDSASLVLRQALGSGRAVDPSAGPEPPRRITDRVMPMGMGGGGMGTLQALLTELSGMKKPRGFMNRVVRRVLGMRPKAPPKYRMLVMMATNMPEALDEALLRPGRIDRIYKVGYPSKPGRVRTYEGYLSKVRHQLTAEDIDKLATITPYATGATIKDTVNEALINAIRAGRDAITWADVVKAKQLKDLGPPEDVEYIERERHAVAVHEACHAVAAYRVRQHMTIDIATIEKGGTYLGMVASIPPEDQFTRWRSEYEADIMVSLASLAGERMFFDGDNSSGVSGDLETATQIATMMEGYWGMGSTVASHGVTQKVGIGGGGRPGKGDEKDKKDLLESNLGNRIEDLLGDIMERVGALLAENRRAVLSVAHALETHKTVTGDDIRAIIEGRPGTLIDGTPYGTHEFSQVAEEYHAQVVAAHKGHLKVDVPLPVFNGHMGPPRLAELPADPTRMELTEAEVTGRLWRRPDGDGNGSGTGDGAAGDGEGADTGDGDD
jgi:ATP-dependent Zn protease